MIKFLDMQEITDSLEPDLTTFINHVIKSVRFCFLRRAPGIIQFVLNPVL